MFTPTILYTVRYNKEGSLECLILLTSVPSSQGCSTVVYNASGDLLQRMYWSSTAAGIAAGVSMLVFPTNRVGCNYGCCTSERTIHVTCYRYIVAVQEYYAFNIIVLGILMLSPIFRIYKPQHVYIP